MKLRALVRLVLLVIALGSPAVWGFRQWERSQALASAMTPAGDDIPRIDGDQVVMTYFTSGVRCRSCREIERLSRETATKDFPAELSNQRLVFRVINTDEPGNAAYVPRYQLTSKTVVISHRRDGREVAWKDMADVWELLDQPETFRAYLGREIRNQLQP
jgi:hypothetical protein